jgi:chromosome segregation ATPase
MAETVEDEIQNAQNMVVSRREQSSKMRKTLKEKIYETVSTLRHLFAKINISSESKRSEIKDLTNKVNKLEDELQSYRRSKTRHSSPHLLTTQMN